MDLRGCSRAWSCSSLMAGQAALKAQWQPEHAVPAPVATRPQIDMYWKVLIAHLDMCDLLCVAKFVT